MICEYKQLCERVLAIPVITGAKSQSERFAGALDTLTVEGMMQNGVTHEAQTLAAHPPSPAQLRIYCCRVTCCLPCLCRGVVEGRVGLAVRDVPFSGPELCQGLRRDVCNPAGHQVSCLPCLPASELPGIPLQSVWQCPVTELSRAFPLSRPPSPPPLPPVPRPCPRSPALNPARHEPRPP
jgi:hypothetical protein